MWSNYNKHLLTNSKRLGHYFDYFIHFNQKNRQVAIKEWFENDFP